VADARDYGHAVLTALLGALVWALLEPIPLLGGLLAIVAWVAVVKWRYRLGWIGSIAIGIAAWAAAVVVPRGPRVGGYRFGFGTRCAGCLKRVPADAFLHRASPLTLSSTEPSTLTVQPPSTRQRRY